MLHWRDGKASIESYWSPSEQVVLRTPQAHAAVLRDALLKTVQRQVHGYEHVGITLGGGLDAAIVLGAIRRVAPDVRVSSFTIGTSANDWEIVGAREAAQAFGTEHREYAFDPAVISTELPRLVWLTEDCGGREEAMLQMHVLREAGAQTSAVFGGHGAQVSNPASPGPGIVEKRHASLPVRASNAATKPRMPYSPPPTPTMTLSLTASGARVSE